MSSANSTLDSSHTPSRAPPAQARFVRLFDPGGVIVTLNGLEIGSRVMSLMRQLHPTDCPQRVKPATNAFAEAATIAEIAKKPLPSFGFVSHKLICILFPTLRDPRKLLARTSPAIDCQYWLLALPCARIYLSLLARRHSLKRPASMGSFCTFCSVFTSISCCDARGGVKAAPDIPVALRPAALLAQRKRIFRQNFFN